MRPVHGRSTGSLGSMQIASRIRALRENSSKSEPELCRLLDISVSAYDDLEAYDHELFSALSLRQVQLLAQFLGVSVHELVTGQKFIGEPLPLEGVAQLVRCAMARDSLSVDAFEDKAGWELSEFLASPLELAQQRSIDFLRDVASAIGVDYLRILAAVGQHAA